MRLSTAEKLAAGITHSGRYLVEVLPGAFPTHSQTSEACIYVYGEKHGDPKDHVVAVFYSGQRAAAWLHKQRLINTA